MGEPDYLSAIHLELHTLVEMLTLLSFTLWSVPVVLCAVFFQNPGELPSDKEYDFIIAGGVYAS